MNLNKIEDNRLVARVRRIKCGKSLEILIERHTPLYCSIVRRMCKKYNNWHNVDELIAEKEYVIYQSAVKFDKTKNIKFSTFIGNQAKWSYLNKCNKIQKTIKKETVFIENMNSEEHAPCATIEAQEAMEVSLGMLRRHQDQRIPALFNLRYKVGKNNKEMPWHLVGKEMNLSAQGCINLHNAGIKFLQNQFKKEGILC